MAKKKTSEKNKSETVTNDEAAEMVSSGEASIPAEAVISMDEQIGLGLSGKNPEQMKNDYSKHKKFHKFLKKGNEK